jgi:hypothetical protein
MNLGCARHMFEKYSNTKFREICLVGADLFHADGQKVMTLSRFSERA